MKSAYDGLTMYQIMALPPDERRRRWEQDRQTVADTWFGGDTQRAQQAFDALPYSAIPDWVDLDRVTKAITGTEPNVDHNTQYVTDTDLDRFEAIARPIYQSTATAGKASQYLVSDLGQYIVRLVAEVRRLRSPAAPHGRVRQHMTTTTMQADELRPEHLGHTIEVHYEDVTITGKLCGYRHEGATDIPSNAGPPIRFTTACVLTFEFGDATIPRSAQVTIPAPGSG